MSDQQIIQQILQLMMGDTGAQPQPKPMYPPSSREDLIRNFHYNDYDDDRTSEKALDYMLENLPQDELVNEIRRAAGHGRRADFYDENRNPRHFATEEAVAGNSVPEDAEYSNLPRMGEEAYITNRPYGQPKPPGFDQMLEGMDRVQTEGMQNTNPRNLPLQLGNGTGPNIPDDIWAEAEQIYLEHYGPEGFGGDGSMLAIENIAMDLMSYRSRGQQDVEKSVIDKFDE